MAKSAAFYPFHEVLPQMACEEPALGETNSPQFYFKFSTPNVKFHTSCFMFHVSCFMFHVSCFMLYAFFLDKKPRNRYFKN